MRGEVYCITGDEIRALSRPTGWLPDTFGGGEGLLNGRVCVFFFCGGAAKVSYFFFPGKYHFCDIFVKNRVSE